VTDIKIDKEVYELNRLTENESQMVEEVSQ
jgi:hypothetical protein